MVVYDDHPNAQTLYEAHIKAKGPQFQNGRLQAQSNRISEQTIWSYVTQIANAIKAVHDANLAVRVPTLETIHWRLGHASYRVAYDVGLKMRAEGVSVDLSEPPYECESYIRGKQRRTPMPQIRERDRAIYNWIFS